MENVSTGVIEKMNSVGAPINKHPLNNTFLMI